MPELHLHIVSQYYLVADYFKDRDMGGGLIVFGADPVGVSVGVSVTLSCLHDIS